MKPTGNTVLITGGASGIGRGLAEALHRRGDQVIISGRDQASLDAVTAANPGMASLPLDITDPDSVLDMSEQALTRFPAINVLINNAGIMRPEDLKTDPGDAAAAEAVVATNLLGTIRVSAALLPHLRRQADATLVTMSSGLAFVPMWAVPTYCATKAAVHSWSISVREQLRGTSVRVVEIIPPYVQTGLLNEDQKSDPNAMPLDEFVTEAMRLLEHGHEEVVVGRAEPLRFAVERGTLVGTMAVLNGATA